MLKSLSLSFLILAIPLSNPSFGADFQAIWNFTGIEASLTPLPGTVNNPHIELQDVTNSGVATPPDDSWKQYRTSEWTGTTAPNLNQYIQFGFIPLNGETLKFQTFQANLVLGRSTDVTRYQLRSSLDNFTTIIDSEKIVNNFSQLAFNPLDINLTSIETNLPLTFRLYGYGGSGIANSRFLDSTYNDLGWQNRPDDPRAFTFLGTVENEAPSPDPTPISESYSVLVFVPVLLGIGFMHGQAFLLNLL